MRSYLQVRRNLQGGVFYLPVCPPSLPSAGHSTAAQGTVDFGRSDTAGVDLQWCALARVISKIVSTAFVMPLTGVLPHSDAERLINCVQPEAGLGGLLV